MTFQQNDAIEVLNDAHYNFLIGYARGKGVRIYSENKVEERRFYPNLIFSSLKQIAQTKECKNGYTNCNWLTTDQWIEKCDNWFKRSITLDSGATAEATEANDIMFNQPIDSLTFSDIKKLYELCKK